MTTGKLIIIEGTDGSGKGTQLELLIKYCKKEKIPYATFDFPQYDNSFFGTMCGKFLHGDYGSLENTSPYLVSVPYAADRWQAKDAMVKALSQGKLVFVNRYAPSNAVYQAAKLPPKKRQEFIDWEFQLEYKEFGIPREDVVIYLNVPVAVSQKLIDQKEKRGYLKGKKKDIHEESLKLMKTTEELYNQFCKKYRHWLCLDCTEKGEILSKNEIHEKILIELKKRKLLS